MSKETLNQAKKATLLTLCKKIAGEEESFSMQDITAPQAVEILVRKDKKVIWINIDGVCRLRCCRIKQLEINLEG